MYLRTAILALIIILNALGGRGDGGERAGPGPGDSISAGHQPPLPFLGSGGVVVPSPALESSSTPPPLRSAGGSGASPVVPRSSQPGLQVFAVSHYLEAGRDACLLGTPPPQPHSSLA